MFCDYDHANKGRNRCGIFGLRRCWYLAGLAQEVGGSALTRLTQTLGAGLDNC
jgi:hypothetical protein